MKYISYKITLILSIIGIIGCNAPTSSGNKAEILEPDDFMEKLRIDKNAILLDVRRADEYNAGHIANAILLDVTDSIGFSKGIELLEKNKNIYIYCRSGRRSQTATKYLIEKGFDVIDLKGGYNAWEKYINNK